MKLSKETCLIIRQILETTLDDLNDNMAMIAQNELPEVYQLFQYLPDRFTIEINRIELVPESHDTIINIMVKHILELNDDNADFTTELRALYKYIEQVHKFDLRSTVDYTLAELSQIITAVNNSR